ncbi:hypothetical protein T11_3124 [Trichinella zimbabwensis]|uniref:Uncharacterized protein n=1 Tax=Trichinella zimbabwensis TaxID=268475 RepID=A0A0V1H5N5_9BILA|nr:hypothetical protein T11_3124 [Trichinella zimbabwensis]
MPEIAGSCQPNTTGRWIEDGNLHIGGRSATPGEMEGAAHGCGGGEVDDQVRNADALSPRVCKQSRAMNPTADAQEAAMTLGLTGRIQEWQDADPELQKIWEWLEKRNWP